MLYLDLETYSDLDLKKVSLDRYAAHPSTEILMCAYAGETGAVELWEQSDGPDKLAELHKRMKAERLIPWNCAFERTLIAKVWRMTALKWWDAMVHALYAGLPAGLKDCNRVPLFANEAETSKETLLINKFCKPQKDGSRRDKTTDPEDWRAFCDYCKADVADTRLIAQWLEPRFPIPEKEVRAWEIDQKINDRGMPVDRYLAALAWEEAQRLQAKSVQELKELTGLDNPNSPAQLLAWVRERGYPYTGLAKELVKKALNEDPDPEDKALENVYHDY